MQRDAIGLLALVGRPRAPSALEVVTVDGRLLAVIDVDLRRGGPLTLVLDPKSGLILREPDTVADPHGHIEERFADYRDVDGIQVAFWCRRRLRSLARWRA